MTYDRYYYSKLGDIQKAAYKTIYAAFERFEKEIFLNCGMLPVEDVWNIVYAIDLDNPHMFYVDFGNIRIKTVLGMIVATVTYF